MGFWHVFLKQHWIRRKLAYPNWLFLMVSVFPFFFYWQNKLGKTQVFRDPLRLGCGSTCLVPFLKAVWDVSFRYLINLKPVSLKPNQGFWAQVHYELGFHMEIEYDDFRGYNSILNIWLSIPMWWARITRDLLFVFFLSAIDFCWLVPLGEFIPTNPWFGALDFVVFSGCSTCSFQLFLAANQKCWLSHPPPRHEGYLHKLHASCEQQQYPWL